MKGPRIMLATATAVGVLMGSAVSVTAQEGASDPTTTLPVEFTGHIECGPERGQNQWEQLGTNSEPRLEGAYYYSEVGGGSPAGAAAGTLRIENADGAWQGSMVYAYLSDGTGTTGSTVLTGEGAYEGLSAIWEERMLFPDCAADVRGLLIEGAPPAAPEAYRSE
jgi:hypothetical protein